MTTAEEYYRYYSRHGLPGWFGRLGALRQAIIRCDGPEVLDILRSRCSIDPKDPLGCWIWTVLGVLGHLGAPVPRQGLGGVAGRTPNASMSWSRACCRTCFLGGAQRL